MLVEIGFGGGPRNNSRLSLSLPSKGVRPKDLLEETLPRFTSFLFLPFPLLLDFFYYSCFYFYRYCNKEN
jgi:hypothetical protein